MFLFRHRFRSHGDDHVADVKVGVFECFVEVVHFSEAVGVGGLFDEVVEEVL